MTLRKPPDTSEENVPREILPAVHDVIVEVIPVNSDENDTQSGEIRLEQPVVTSSSDSAVPEAQPEIDRTETYLKGPTVFTA